MTSYSGVTERRSRYSRHGISCYLSEPWALPCYSFGYLSVLSWMHFSAECRYRTNAHQHTQGFSELCRAEGWYLVAWFPIHFLQRMLTQDPRWCLGLILLHTLRILRCLAIFGETRNDWPAIRGRLVAALASFFSEANWFTATVAGFDAVLIRRAMLSLS
jgi:hypothetical protein